MTKPERPEVMDRDDAEGAAAAATYFLSLRSYMMATGDTAEWEAMSHESCGFCSAGLEQARLIAERADVFSGGEIRADVVEVYLRDELTGIVPIDLSVSESAILITDAAGAEVFKADVQQSLARVEVGREGDRWVIVTVTNASEDA